MTLEQNNQGDIQPRASSPKTDINILKKLYPDYLKLKQLIITHRHGDRTPLTPRLPGLLPNDWNFCAASNQSISLLSKDLPNDSRLLGIDNTASLKYHKVMEAVNGHSKVYDPSSKSTSKFRTSTCAYGQLTDIGRSTLFGHGTALRKIYVDYLKFLPSSFDSLNPDDLYLRTTDYPRTLESLQHLMFGFFPNASNLIIRSRTHNDETMFADYKCRRVYELSKELNALLRPELKKEWQVFREELISKTDLSKYLSKPEFEHPTAIHKIYDSLSSAFAHNLPWPKGYTHEHHKILDDLEVKLWFGGILKEKEGVKLGIGRLYQDISYHMHKALKKPDESQEFSAAKLTVFSGHDTTIGPLIIGLGGFDKKWPPYGAITMFELMEDTRQTLKDTPSAKKESHYVRVKYNDSVLELPHCSKPGNHHPEAGKGFCTFNAFMEILKENSFENYFEACGGFKDEISDR